MRKGTRRFGWLIILCLVVSGCDPNPPSGTRDRQQPTGPRLRQACDEVAQRLAADINGIVEREFRGYRVSLLLGDLENRTGDVPTQDFAYMQHRIKNQLMQSKLFRDSVRVFENRDKWERTRNKEFGDREDPDILQTGTDQTAQRVNEEYALFLSGEAYAVHRSQSHLYYVAFKLVRASSGEEVFVHDYELVYQQSD